MSLPAEYRISKQGDSTQKYINRSTERKKVGKKKTVKKKNNLIDRYRSQNNRSALETC